jgi:PAS domain S-box-containing protein
LSCSSLYFTFKKIISTNMPEQDHFSSLFENSSEGFLITNSQGRIIMANPAATLIFGYSIEEFKSITIEMLVPKEKREKHVGLRSGFHHHPQNRTMGSGRDLFASKKDGSVFPVEVSLSHYNKDGDTFVIAFIVDISPRKEIENNLVKKQKELENVTNQMRKLNTELERKVDERTHILKEALQKLELSQTELSEALDKERQLNEIKSRFVSMASHEFRTPLSAVLSSASLLSKYQKEEEQEKRDRHITRIKDSVKHLNDILEDFLSLGRLDEGRIAAEPVEFNLKELINEVLADLKLLMKPGQHFQLSFSGQEKVFADKRLLKNILINVLSNAIKFSGEAMPVDIAIQSRGEDVEINVTDKGIGISEEDQEHLFTSFFRATNASNIQGTGLGLHIVKRYIDLMNGEVTLRSRLDEGTIVTIIFPSEKKIINEIYTGNRR